MVASDVRALLEAGFSDGALSRWRTLHEIAVVSFFVLEEGEETAGKFIVHQVVENWKAARQYQSHCRRLGYEPLEPEEMTTLEQGYQAAVVNYGESFKRDYGWAAGSFGRKNPTLADLEARVGLDHWRPYYGMACQSVHSTAKGLALTLGLPEHSSALLAGPSSLGLTDPGQNTAISLAQVTSAFFALGPTLDSLVASRIVVTLSGETCEAFATVDRGLSGPSG